MLIGPDDARMQHARQAEVMHVLPLARHLAGDIDAGNRLAHDAVIRRLLERRFRIDFELEALLADEIGVGDEARLVAFYPDDAVLDDELVHLRAKAVRTSRNECVTRARCCAAQLSAALEDGEVGSGYPLVRCRPGVAHHHLDALEGDVQLVGCHLRECGSRASAQIHFAGEHGDAAIARDREPGVDRILGN